MIELKKKYNGDATSPHCHLGCRANAGLYDWCLKIQSDIVSLQVFHKEEAATAKKHFLCLKPRRKCWVRASVVVVVVARNWREREAPPVVLQKAQTRRPVVAQCSARDSLSLIYWRTHIRWRRVRLPRARHCRCCRGQHSWNDCRFPLPQTKLYGRQYNCAERNVCAILPSAYTIDESRGHLHSENDITGDERQCAPRFLGKKYKRVFVSTFAHWEGFIF